MTTAQLPLDSDPEIESLRPLAQSLGNWPRDVLKPRTQLWDLLAARIAVETGSAPILASEASAEVAWREVGNGIFYKLLATDLSSGRASLLVRLRPGSAYPPHEHADVEELHLLDGELWIDDRKLVAGDYNRAEAGSADRRVWSETGCCAIFCSA